MIVSACPPEATDAAGTNAVYHPTAKAMTDRDQAHNDIVGHTAHVFTRIPGGDRPGEITVKIRGGDEVWLAYADEEIPRGEAVLILSRHSALAVDVARLGQL